MAILGLEAIDGRLLDGLAFCARVYDAFDDVSSSPDGLTQVRLLTTPRAKRLVEELLPLARFVQHRYTPGLRIEVKWSGGNQTHDAYLRLTGLDVDARGLPRRQFVEITTADHQNAYLTREHLHARGFAFSPRSTHRERRTRDIVSKPSGFDHGEHEAELTGQIARAIERKADRPGRYQPTTTLLVRCVVHAPVLDDEWATVISDLGRREWRLPFREVILSEHVGDRFVTVWHRPRARGRARLHGSR